MTNGQFRLIKMNEFDDGNWIIPRTPITFRQFRYIELNESKHEELTT